MTALLVDRQSQLIIKVSVLGFRFFALGAEQHKLDIKGLKEGIVKRIGIFGGTFDPVHNGHLLLAESCCEQIQLDEIRWIPVTISPHKQTLSVSSGTHRIEMLRLATGGNPAFVVDPIELDRGGVSYTVDTLTDLSAKQPDAAWFLLMGADALAGLHSWHRPEEILRLAMPVVVERPGASEVDYRSLANLVTPDRLQEIQSLRVRMTAVDISSSQLRAKAAAGMSLRYQTPAAVGEYIRQHKLYIAD